MENKSTHFIFDGNKIVISPDLKPIVDFLGEIEKEIESFLGFEKKIESIRKQHLETIKLVQLLAGKLKENSIDFNFSFSEDPSNIGDKLKFSSPTRSKMIVLFAYLETLFCLNIAYENKTSDEQEIRRLAMNKNTIKPFLETFCLNKENKWGGENPDRLKNTTADNLRRLRNSLTHFFSVDKSLSVADAFLDDKSRKLEQITDFQIKFISPEDLYEIIKGAGELMIKKWSKDCENSLRLKTNEFKENILSVNKLIENCGAKSVKNEQINI